MEEDQVSALVPRPPSAVVLMEGKTSGAETGGDAEICQEGDGSGEVPWVLVTEDVFSSQLGKEAEKSDAHDVDNEANAAVQAALFRQIGRGAAGERGGGVVRESAAPMASGRGVFEESAHDGGGLDPTLKAAVERQKKERVRLCSAVFVALCVGHLNLKSCMYGVGLADGRVNISLPPFRDVHVLSHAKT